MKESQESKETKKVKKPKGHGLFSRIKNKLVQYKRVIEIARKPEKEEFLSSAKIIGGGIIFIGIIGFIIFLLYFLVIR